VSAEHAPALAVLGTGEAAEPNPEPEIVPEPEPPGLHAAISPICTEPNLPMDSVTINDATVLAEPRELGRTVMTVPSGIQVEVVGRSNQWMAVRLAGASVSGYLHCSTLRRLTPTSDNPF
jgi:hypothetical protein